MTSNHVTGLGMLTSCESLLVVASLARLPGDLKGQLSLRERTQLVDVVRQVEVDHRTRPLTKGRILTQRRVLEERDMSLPAELLIGQSRQEPPDLRVVRLDARN